MHDRPFEAGGRDVTFPHPLPQDTVAALRMLSARPWMDSLTLDFALDGVRSLGLGRRSRPDLLVLGLSATDYIGHRWGPGSREMHDQQLRLDRYLGAFLDSLNVLVQGRPLLVVLTADHGVTPYPEAARAEGHDAGRLGLDAFVRGVNRTLPPGAALSAGPGLIYGDTSRLRAVGVSPESLATTLMLRIRRVHGVVDAWTPATLGAPLRSNVGAVRWRRSLPVDFSWRRLLLAGLRGPGSGLHLGRESRLDQPWDSQPGRRHRAHRVHGPRRPSRDLPRHRPHRGHRADPRPAAGRAPGGEAGWEADWEGSEVGRVWRGYRVPRTEY